MGDRRYDVLWRLRTEEWKKVVNGLDADLSKAPRSLRCWVEMRDGLWVGTHTVLEQAEVLFAKWVMALRIMREKYGSSATGR